MVKKYYIYLIYLIVVTLVVTVVSFSRYSTIAEGSSNAVVAVPVIDYVPVSAFFNNEPISIVSGGGIVIHDLQPGDELIYHFKICNFKGTKTNQVLLKYAVSVDFEPDPKLIPLTYAISPAAVYQSQDIWTYLGYGDPVTHNYTLTVLWSEDLYDAAYLNKEQQIEIRIDTEQADRLE
ncbi:MAG: hypothetical protein PHC91_04675 [Eubacteriales bacterium]|nr:hypothetical protein [Eubacteriales bacterium]